MPSVPQKKTTQNGPAPKAKPQTAVDKIDPSLQALIRPVEGLEFDPMNARLHPEGNIEDIKASLIRYGQRSPIVVDRATGHVMKGNGTLRAAKELGWTRIAAAEQDFADQVEAVGYGVADNRTGESSKWDFEVLAKLDRIVQEGGGQDMVGWSERELVQLRAGIDGPVDLDDVPEPLKEVVTKPGDIWLLGDHRILCGDSTSAKDVSKLMSGTQARMMFTDPPWNVAIGQDSNPRHRQRVGLQNDSLSSEDFARFLNGFAGAFKDYVVGDVYCVLGASEWPTLDLALRKQGYHWSATIIWVKDVFVLGRSKYHRRYEPIWYGWHTKGKSSFGMDRDLDDVWEIPRPKRSEDHPTMKPVDLVINAIRNSSRAGDTVVDPFGGSGTTLIAAEQTKRRCLMMELDPAYCDVIIRRWEAVTGGQAKKKTPGG